MGYLDFEDHDNTFGRHRVSLVGLGIDWTTWVNKRSVVRSLDIPINTPFTDISMHVKPKVIFFVNFVIMVG